MPSPKKQKRTLLDGLEPLAYLGVEATSPASVVTDVRDPISGTDKDYYGFYVGDQWINRNTLSIWELVSKEISVATWVPLTTGALPAGGLDGQLIIGATGAPALWANLISSDGSITIVNGPNTIDITTAGGAGIVATLSDNAGNAAIPLAGDIVLSRGANINTDALTTANTVIVNLDTSIYQPATNAAGDEGVYYLDGHRYLHEFGTGNTFLGEDSGNLTNTGTGDTGIGYTSLEALTTGTFNTGCGAGSLTKVTTGQYNTALGAAAGSVATTGISNIYINNAGVASEVGKLRIGDPAVPANTLTNAYIDGIYQKVTGNPAIREVVTVDADGKLCSALLTDSATVTVNNIAGAISFTAAGALPGASTFTTDAGNAVPTAGGVLFDVGGLNIRTAGAGNTVTTHLKDSIALPATNAAGTTGLITLNGIDFVSGYGTNNAFIGGAGNRTLTGNSNTFVGKEAGFSLTSGIRNTGVGKYAGVALTTGNYNTILGDTSATSLAGGSSNIAIGSASLSNETTGSRNISIGAGSSNSVVGRSDNVFVGDIAGAFAVGSNNIAIGSDAGTAGIASNNIIIGTPGVAADASTTRIGKTTQTSAYVGGVYQKTTAAGTREYVVIDSTSKLGSVAIGPIPVVPAELSNFKAYLAASLFNVTGDGTFYPIPFNGELWDLGGNFNTATGIFTAPIKGIYSFNCNILLQDVKSVSGHNNMDIMISVLGTYTQANAQCNINPIPIIDNGNQFSFVATTNTIMDVGDTARLVVQVGIGSKTVDIIAQGAGLIDIRTWFSGFLVARVP